MKDLPQEFKKIRKVGVTISLNEKNLQRLKEHLKDYHNGEPVSSIFDFWLQGWVENVEEYEKETDKRREQSRKKKEQKEKINQRENEGGNTKKD